MKRFVSMIAVLSIVFLALTFSVSAAVPNMIYYQGQLTDALGAPLDTVINMTFTIYDDSSTGAAVWWSETQPGVVVSNGLFTVLLGSAGGAIVDTVFRGDFRWLGIQIASDPEITPRTRLVTVPYAHRVSTVDGASGGLISGDLEATGAIVAGDVSGGYFVGGALYVDNAGIGVWPDPMANLSVAQTGDFAAFFGGDVLVTGFLMKEGGGFKIDHPLEPENKYLYHSFVESPDMKNVYDGVVTLDARGEAAVELPDYFEAANKDFRYQLTCIGGFAPVYIAEEISGNQFKIAGGEPGMKVSWLVTGIRKDPVAEAKRIQVEVEKEPVDRGRYLSPEAYGLSEEYGIYHKRHERVEGKTQEKSVGQRD
ncbi:MAG: hypothetical protein WBD64_08820 [Candidatus Zixiibacteriota bacterium]